jgi:hypothetical protein
LTIVLDRLRARDEWKFFGVLPQADRPMAYVWWALVLLRGVLPATFAIAMGVLIGAVQRGESLTNPLAIVGVVFVLLQTTSPLHQSIGKNLGSRTASWLYDELTRTCVRPPGMGHLEDPRLTTDLTVARDFDLGISGPPLSISMDFIGSGLVEFIAGVTAALLLAAYAWWAPLLLGGAWFATQWLLRESAVWRDRNTDEVREAQRHADYAYRLAVDPPAAKELRLFGLSTWTVERFTKQRRRLFDLRWEATRLRERPVVWSLLIVLSANVAVFASNRIRSECRTYRSRSGGDVRERRRDHQHDCVRRIVVGAGRCSCAGRRGAAPEAGNGPRRRAGARHAQRAEPAGARDPFP